MLSGLLQVGYNMADNIVVGRFSGDTNALAAVGSSNIFNTLIINFLLGFSGGAGVIVAQHFGAKDEKKLTKAIHTSMTISLISGVAFGLLGFLLTRPVLILMGTKPELLDSASLYMHIICIGIPANVIYNFGAAVLRSVGDSKTSLYILSGTGLVNVLLNLFFVIVCNMTVDGVAYATAISQYLSAILVVLIMVKQRGATKLSIKKLRIDRSIFSSIMRLGLPAGLSNSLFALSNMVITSAFNSFSTETISARTVVQNVDTIVTTLITSYQRSTMTFTAQNYGAGKFDRIKKTFWYSMLQMLIITVIVSQLLLVFHRPVASLYIKPNAQNKEEILRIAGGFFKVLLNTYFLCGIMNILEAMLRGIKYSLLPAVVSIFTIIVFRIAWVYLVFPYEPFDTANWLMASFPISWGLAIIAFIIITFFAWHKVKKLFKTTKDSEAL
jgi:putative MATE family efflux protein